MDSHQKQVKGESVHWSKQKKLKTHWEMVNIVDIIFKWNTTMYISLIICLMWEITTTKVKAFLNYILFPLNHTTVYVNSTEKVKRDNIQWRS